MSIPELTRTEYTGANRCWPCTALNLGILAVACLALALVEPVASLLVAVAGLAVITFRGYLVPYTPTYAPRLVERLPWDPFHGTDEPPDGRQTAGAPPGTEPAPGGQSTTEDESATAADSRAGRPAAVSTEKTTLADTAEGDESATSEGEAILEALVAVGVLQVAEDDVVLDDAFEERWKAEMRALSDRAPADLATVAQSVSPTSAAARAVTENDRTYVVLSDGSGTPAGEAWLRRPVAVAETAAARALEGWGPEGSALDADQRAVAAHGLGVFLETCPVCDADLVERKAGGCCGPPKTDAEGRPLQALVCTRCRAQFAEFE